MQPGAPSPPDPSDKASVPAADRRLHPCPLCGSWSKKVNRCFYCRW